MKIDPNLVKMIPPQIGEGLCVWGVPPEEVQQWCHENNIQQEVSGTFTNLIIPDGRLVEELFQTDR